MKTTLFTLFVGEDAGIGLSEDQTLGVSQCHVGGPLCTAPGTSRVWSS